MKNTLRSSQLAILFRRIYGAHERRAEEKRCTMPLAIYGAWECDEIASRNIDPRFAGSLLFRWERFKKTVFYKFIPAELRQQAYNFYARLAKY